MLRIGEFSKLTQVPIKTLRYYDEIGLFKPAQLDASTGYRAYSYEQLPLLNRILAYKGLGFSLSEITQLLDEDLSTEQIRGMLRLKRAEANQRLEEEQMRLQFVESRIRQIEMEGKMPDYEIVLKSVDPVRVASIRGIAPSMSQIGPTLDRLFDTVINHISQQGKKYTMTGITLYHDMEHKDTDIQVEAALPTGDDVKDGSDVKVRTLPGESTVASVVHHGPFSEMYQAYDAVLKWINDNDYHFAGPSREINLQYERGGDQSKYVTEIQVPVKKG